MNNIFLSIIIIASPLMIITIGAIFSEYCGRMALFMEGIINLGAFFCYAFTLATKNPVFGTLLSLILCGTIVFIFERVASIFNANMFLAGLAMNIFFTALTTLLSSIFFNTRGVLYSPLFNLNPKMIRIITTLLCYVCSLVLLFIIKYTETGLCFRITGSNPEFLKAEGININYYNSASWIIASLCGTLGGAVLCLRLNSYVPSLASGRGWTALAAIFLGRKKPLVVVAAVFVFAIAEYLSSYIQNIEILKNIPSSVLLALPYLIALLLIIILPEKENI